MSLSKLYITLLPYMSVYSTIVGINTGINANANTRQPDSNTLLHGREYSNIIGYTGIGIITGITYPISFPLFGCWVLYKNNK